MSAPRAASNVYDVRIRRAENLITTNPSAAEILSFYKQIASFQKSLHAKIAQTGGGDARMQPFGALREALDVSLVLPHYRSFLAVVEKRGPGALAGAARAMAELPAEAWIERLREYWENGGLPGREANAFEQFFSRAILEPYAAYVAARTAAPPMLETPRVCPMCGAEPLLGVLRPEGDGGKRCLVCAFCGHEWNFRRIWCATCGEEDEKKLPVYVAEEFPHIRVEACDTCKTCLRTIDLTKDGNAVPAVDDISAIPLTLWANEHGYSRLQPNLLGA
jgi:FdhE protein